VKQYDEIEEVEEEEFEVEEEFVNGVTAALRMPDLSQPYGFYKTPSDVDMALPAVVALGGGDEGSDGGEENGGLFASRDDEGRRLVG